MRILLVALVALGGAMTIKAQETNADKDGDPTRIASRALNQASPANGMIDFGGFVSLTRDLEPVRQSRRIPIATFNQMSRDPNTIILDTRSKWAYDVVHVKGAVHLNFSDFTLEKLREVIPSRTTRILIYCNNNFREPVAIGFEGANARLSNPAIATRLVADQSKPPEGRAADDRRVIAGTTNKFPTLALNIPTFVNLHGYGYENVYELGDYLDLDDPRLKLAGSGVATRSR